MTFTEYFQQIATVELGFGRDIQVAEKFHKRRVAEKATRRGGQGGKVAQRKSGHAGKENTREYTH